jgi:hypothetical protein
MRRPCLAFIVLVFFFSHLTGQQPDLKAPTLKEPVLLTSCGQSPGPLKIQVFLKKLGINHVYGLQAKAEDLISAKQAGKPFGSVIIVTGSSLKGMGAAGVSIDDEIARTKRLIDELKKEKIILVGAHVEGMERRAQGAAAGDNSDELSIDAVCPFSDMLLVRSDGDSDKRFTAIATSKKVPLVKFEKNMDLSDVLKKLYQK